MYKTLAFITGLLLAVMIFFNGMLTGITGPYLSTLIFHFIGLILISVIWFFNRKKAQKIGVKTLPILFFLPGVLSVVTVAINNITVPQIGITLTIGISLFGQLIMSNIVDHFGLFGMPKSLFKKEKIVGFSIILLGIIAMVTL